MGGTKRANGGSMLDQYDKNALIDSTQHLQGLYPEINLPANYNTQLRISHQDKTQYKYRQT